MFVLLSSPEMLFWIVGLWLSYYTTLVIWDKEAFSNYITGLTTKRILQAPFVLFLIVGYLNLVRVVNKAGGRSIGRTLMKAVLPLGLLLALTGAFISITTRQFEWIMALPGDGIRPRWSSDRITVEDVDPGIHDRILDIDLEKGVGLFKYEPKVTIRSSRSEVHQIGAFPPSKIGDTFFHVLNFGLAPSLTISEQGVIRAQEFVPLKILAPGSSDTFEIQPLPYTFLISLEPERVHQKGAVTASEYNMRDPLYRIRVLEERDVIAEEVTKERISFKNNTLGFHKPMFWVQLEVVKDRGVYLIVAGLFLVLIGIPIYGAERVMHILLHK